MMPNYFVQEQRIIRVANQVSANKGISFSQSVDNLVKLDYQI